MRTGSARFRFTLCSSLFGSSSPCSAPSNCLVACGMLMFCGGIFVSLGDGQVAALVKMLIDEGQTPIMVCSAMGKTTNNLLNAGDFALKDGKVGPI